MLIRALLAVESGETSERLERSLRRYPFATLVVVDPAQIWKSLHQHSFDVLFVSRSALPGDLAAAVEAIRALPDRPDVVLLETERDPAAEERARLLAAGCLAVIHANLSERLLDETLSSLLQRRRDQALAQLGPNDAAASCTLEDFSSSVPAMQHVVQMARTIASTNSNILLLGETGTGKERLARAIHAASPRMGGPFIAVNSGAVTENLVESEMFGHERGAFTGAVRTRRGYFEMAHGGTIFFDEISEMPPALQVKLLRTLEEPAIRRVGGESTVDIDVRVMAATNRDPAREVSAGRFREDLFYRLAVVTLTLPPLRERREDLPKLIDRCLQRVCRRLGRSLPRLAPDTIEAMLSHDWPGNVRELLNTLERAVLFHSIDDARFASCACMELRRQVDATAFNADTPGGRLPREPGWCRGRPLLEARKEVADTFERSYLVDLMRTTHGRIGEAAQLAGLSTRSLSEMLKRHGLRRHRSWSEEVIRQI